MFLEIWILESFMILSNANKSIHVSIASAIIIFFILEMWKAYWHIVFTDDGATNVSINIFSLSNLIEYCFQI